MEATCIYHCISYLETVSLVKARVGNVSGIQTALRNAKAGHVDKHARDTVGQSDEDETGQQMLRGTESCALRS